MTRWTSVLSAAVAIVLTGCGVAAETLSIGSAAPEWKDLPGTDDRTHSLADLKESKVIVVAFTCNHCPYAKAYEDRFSEFAKEYEDKGVEFIAINVNNLDEDKLPAMKARAAEKDFTFAYIYDASQKIGKDYGAKTTPHIFVLDQDRKVRYIGLFDDNPLKAAAVKKRHVADAVDALLKGEDPPVAQTTPAGCSIKYE